MLEDHSHQVGRSVFRPVSSTKSDVTDIQYNHLCTSEVLVNLPCPILATECIRNTDEELQALW